MPDDCHLLDGQSVSRSVCACTPATPCIFHAERLREHQAMFDALLRIAAGTLPPDDDPGTYAERVLRDVRYQHAHV